MYWAVAHEFEFELYLILQIWLFSWKMLSEYQNYDISVYVKETSPKIRSRPLTFSVAKNVKSTNGKSYKWSLT